MIRKKLMASLVAASIGIAAYTSLNADTFMQEGPKLPTQADKGIVTYFTKASETFFDYFDEQHARKESLHVMSADATFQGPYSLMVTGKDDANSIGMILASLGLMAVIVHRRRNI